jgi:hypothetical protein
MAGIESYPYSKVGIESISSFLEKSTDFIQYPILNFIQKFIRRGTQKRARVSGARF